MRDRGNRLTSPTQKFYYLMLEVEKSFRFFRSRKRIPEVDIVESIDKDKFFAHPNEDVLNMAMFRYVRTRAHIFTQRALQQFKATKRKKQMQHESS